MNNSDNILIQINGLKVEFKVNTLKMDILIDSLNVVRIEINDLKEKFEGFGD